MKYHASQQHTQHSPKTSFVLGVLGIVLLSILSSLTFFSPANAAPNYQMNYQGKLTNASNVAVADGTYNMRFWLLTSSTVATTSAIWTESLTGTNKVQVTNGLFSVMLGSTTPLTSVDFNQTLYLGVEIGGTSTAAWDGEMSPRKILGTVPAAFEADRLDGLTSTQFVRSDATTTISSSSPLTILSIVQNGVGDILNLFDGTTEVFSVIDGGNIGIGSTTPSRTLTVNGDIYGANITATGTATFANLLTTGSSTIGGGTGTTGLTINGTATTTNLKITSLTASRALFTDASNVLTTSGVSQYLIDSLSDETGTGSLVFSTSPLLAGFRSNASSTIGGGTGATGLTINGGATTTGSTYMGGTLSLGSTSPNARLTILGSGRSDIFRFASSTGSSLLGLNSRGVLTFGASATSSIYLSGGFETGNTNPNLNYNNIAIGNNALVYLSPDQGAQEGGFNIAIGADALKGSSTVPMLGNHNIALGSQALTGNTDGSDNIGMGYSALLSNTIGGGNIALGNAALSQNIDGSNNIAFGASSLENNVSGLYNIALGYNAMLNNATGTSNVALGQEALYWNKGQYNIGIGDNAIASGQYGARNVGVGVDAGFNLGFSVASEGNILLGYQAGYNQSEGSNNIVIGYQSDLPQTSGSNQLNIGNLIYGTGLDGTFSTLSTGKIGIGSTTPSRKLTVNGDIYGANITATGTATFANLLATGSSTIGGGTGSTGLTINGTATTTNLKVTSLTASRALFTTADNLLTTTGLSQYLIDSLSDETGTGSLVFSTNPLLAGFRSNASSTIGDGTGAGGLTINGNSTTTGNEYIMGASMIGSRNAYDTDTYKFSVSGHSLFYDSAGLTDYDLSVEHSGGVSFSGTVNSTVDTGNSNGETVAAYHAGVYGTNNSKNNYAFLALRRNESAWDATPNALPTGSYLPSIGFAGSSGTSDGQGMMVGASLGAIIDGTVSSGLLPTALIFHTSQSSSTALTERMRITSTGTVGIGTTTPSKLLTVAGDIFTPNNISAGSSTITYASSTGLTATNLFGSVSSLGFASSTAITVSGTSYLTNLLATGSSTIGGGTGTTGLTINGTATTTNLKITSLTASRALFTDASNVLTTSGVSQYLIDSLSDETGTGSLVFSTNPLLAGFRSNASSTIGGGTGATGLTIYGNSTTTLNTYIGGTLSLGSTTPSALLTVVGTGTTNLFRFASSSGASLLALDNRGVLTFGTSSSADIFINGGSQTGNPQQNGNNVAIGNGTMWYASTTDPAQYNIAIGVQALLGSSTVPMSGDHNVAIGTQALASNASGTNNVAIGSLTLLNNSTGYDNTAVGYSSLLYNVSGYQNTGVGMAALQANTQGYQNTAMGYASQLNNTLGTNNTSGGWGSLALNSTGVENTAFGSQSLFQTTGSYNTAQGFKAMYGNISGIANTATGWQALVANDSGIGNTGFGYGTLSGNTNGSYNTALGIAAGVTNTTGTSNTYLGFGADGSSSGFSSSTAIGTKAIVGCSNCMVLGGTGINYANVGIGTTTPSALLTIGTTTVTGARVAGIKQYFGFVNSVADAVYYGNETYITNVPTATSTLLGDSIRIADTSVLGNVVRGFQILADRGTNTKGENTGIYTSGRTFGIQGVTQGDAGESYIPAGVLAETKGTTQGNALRAYSGTITTEELVSLFHDTSNFTGTGLQMNFGNAGGSFAATSSTAKFLDLQVAGTSKFMIAANGSTTIGDGVVSASLRIPFGGICVDNDGSCVSTTTGQIRSVTSVLGNSDLAEMYFSNQTLHAGEIIALSGGLSIKRAEEEIEENIIGVVSTKPGLTLGFDDTSLIAGENAYPVGLKGRVPIKLSTENGPIKKGDRIALSSIPGVGMKATESSRVVGIALEDYDGTRAYTEGFLNQFGDDMYKEKIVATQTIDPRSQDGCSNGGGNALGEEACVAQKVKKMKLPTPKIDTTREDVLRAFAQESALQTTSANGEVAYVGQAIMFIELTNYQIAGESRVLSELASSTLLLDAREGETVWSRIKTLAQNFVDGVLTVTGIKADRVEVKNELCVDGVCVTADDLRAILQSAHQAPQSATPPQNNTGGGGGGVSVDPGTSNPAPSTEEATGDGGNTTESPPEVTEESPPETVPTTESPPPEPEPTPPEPEPSPNPETPAPESPPNQ